MFDIAFTTMTFWASYSLLVYMVGLVFIGMLVYPLSWMIKDLTNGKFELTSWKDKYHKLYFMNRFDNDNFGGKEFAFVCFCVCSFFLTAFATVIHFVASGETFNDVLLVVADKFQYVMSVFIPFIIYFFVRKSLRAAFAKYDAMITKLKQL